MKNKAKLGRYARGRQFSRVAGEAIKDDAGYIHYLEGIDWRESPRIEQQKLAAIERLEMAGVPARTILVEHPGGSMLRDYVLNHKGNEPDSLTGLDARICELCIRLEELPKLGANADMLIGDAYRLGRLTTLADAYQIKHRAASDAAAAPRTPGIATRDAVLRAWNDDVAARKQKRGRIKRIALSVCRPESTIRDALDELEASGHIRGYRR